MGKTELLATAMSRRTAILLLAAVFMILLVAFLSGTARIITTGETTQLIHRDTIVHGDGARLYAYLRSFWFDGDMNTANELDHYFNFPGSREQQPVIRTTTGYAWNHTPVGCAILWSPFFAVGHYTALHLNKTGPRATTDGYSLPYTLAIAIGTHIYCFLGILLLFSLCCRYASPQASFLACLTVWLATFLPAYLFLYPSMSHALSFFSVSLFLWLWLKIRDGNNMPGWAALGLAGGLMTLVRTQNVIFFILPLFGFFAPGYRLSRAGLILMLVMAAAAFFPQMHVWKITYDSWLTIPQGKEFLHWGRPAIMQVLFSSRHGLFSWTPALVIGAGGIPPLLRRDRTFGMALLSAFILQLYLNAIVDDWWAGTGFGARRFDNCLPLLGIGTALAYQHFTTRRLSRLATAITLGAIAWNLLFLAQYALNWISHMDPIDMKMMILNQWIMLMHFFKHFLA